MPKTVTVTVEGKSLLGFYRVTKKVLTVTSSIGQKSVKLGTKEPEVVAKHLLLQMMQETRVKVY